MSDFTSLGEKLYRELDATQRSALEGQPLIEPTEEEKRNGWTAETLTNYLAERRAGQSLKADPNSLHRKAGNRPSVQNTTYSPHRWR